MGMTGRRASRRRACGNSSSIGYPTAKLGPGVVELFLSFVTRSGRVIGSGRVWDVARERGRKRLRDVSHGGAPKVCTTGGWSTVRWGSRIVRGVSRRRGRGPWYLERPKSGRCGWSGPRRGSRGADLRRAARGLEHHPREVSRSSAPEHENVARMPRRGRGDPEGVEVPVLDLGRLEVACPWPVWGSRMSRLGRR